MCLLCTSFENNELTILEAWSNYGEMADTMDPEHAREVYMMLIEATSGIKGGKLSPPTIEKIKGE